MADYFYWAVIVVLGIGLATVFFRWRLAEKNCKKIRETLRESEEKFQRALDGSRQSDEMKTAFLATMSHEMRTPLNSVIGLSSLILATDLDKEQKEYAEVIRKSGDTLLVLIDDILHFSKANAGKLQLKEEPFDLLDCITYPLDMVAGTAAEKEIELAYWVKPGVPNTLVGDSSRMRQVLLNLLSNGIKFTEKGSVVLTVEAEKRGVEQYEVIFKVTDTGIGISQENQERLFKPFSQVDSSNARKYEGTGLGLSICKSIVTLMKGEIGVKSEPGKGSEFSFSILVDGFNEQLSRSLAPIAKVVESKHVLVAVPLRATQQMIRCYLESWDAYVDFASNAREAIEFLNKGRKYDLAVIDGVLGNELVRPFYEETKGQVPIIGLVSVTLRDRLMNNSLPLSGIVSKPPKQGPFLSVVADALNKAQGASEPEKEEKPVAEPTESPEPEQKRVSEKRHIDVLVAEDNPINQVVITAMLKKMGHRVSTVNNGKEAVLAVEEGSYDLILMDMQMPEMSGLEATECIIEKHPEVTDRPLIFALTANAMPEDRKACMDAGMDDFIAKPVKPTQLQSIVNRHFSSTSAVL